MSKVELIPAIIPRSYEDLVSHLARVKGVASLVQIDVLDGRLTPEASWPYEGDGGEFASITKGEKGFPYWEDIDFEVDLMVEYPAEVLQDWHCAGARRFIVHVESKGVEQALAEIERMNDSGSLENVDGGLNDSAWRTEVGLALNTSTDEEEVLKYAERIDFVQCMGIEHIGFQGEPFDERVLEKIKCFKREMPEKPVAVDGSVNLETAPRLIEAGAERLVAGSAIFGGESVENSMKEFRDIMVE